MKVRELIAVLADMGAHADIREFDVVAFDASDDDIAPVTGVICSTVFQTIEIQTDEL